MEKKLKQKQSFKYLGTKLVLEGKVDGKRGRGRRRKSWTGNMSEMTKMSMAQCSVKALDRSEWRTMVSDLFGETEP